MKRETIKTLIWLFEEKKKGKKLHKFLNPNCEKCKKEAEILTELKKELVTQCKSKVKNG